MARLRLRRLAGASACPGFPHDPAEISADTTAEASRPPGTLPDAARPVHLKWIHGASRAPRIGRSLSDPQNAPQMQEGKGTAMTISTPSEAERRDALADRLFEATVGAFDLEVIYIGDRLGLYRALANDGPATSAELADRAGIAERYAREWLEHQAVGGILDVDDAGRPADARRYSLPAGHAEVLVDPDSLSTMTPMARFVVAGAQLMPMLLEAFRTGGGVPLDASTDMVEAQEAVNRPAFAALLAADWIPALADVEARMRREPTRVADVACGAGWSTIAIARGYPLARVDGIDLDPGSIEKARRNLATAPELGNRVTFAARDAADPELAGRYDLVTIIEALHDMSRPVEVLRACRSLLGPDGAVLVVDEKVADTFVAPGDPTERLMYSYSVLFCLANGLADRPSAATGTVMRSETLRRYGNEAGFRSVSILPVEHDTFRFYRLDP
jgi:2-polyprenyl-3-methyl-5-hydroxy-6-metoxy-1,4-benzoquinol methylase